MILWPVMALYSAFRCGCAGPGPCGPMKVPSGWSRACTSTPTSLTRRSTSHCADSLYRPGEVIRVVAPEAVAAGVDHDDIVLLDPGLGLFQILWHDHAPFSLGNRHRHAGAEEAPQFVAGDRRRVFRGVYGRIHMRAAVHDALEALHQDAVLGVELLNNDIEVGPRGPLRHPVPPAVAQAVELQSVGRGRCHGFTL